ncbi:TPA: hypothetical protein NBJ98_004434 [Citrobacter freundii]|nr:hypothetical protein [Citrobacter freundii]
MATADKNAKSQLLKARVPHEIVNMMNALKHPDETTSQFITISIASEIEKRKLSINSNGESNEEQ